MEHTKHMWRAVLVLIVIAVAAVVARHFLIPESFGAQGFYRFDSLGEYMAKPAVHGDVAACHTCHQPVYDIAQTGKHATVSCEVCHGPLSAHVKDTEKSADALINRSNGTCVQCHEKLRARPEEFPQLELTEHLESSGVISPGEPIPEEVCIACHDAHNPASI